MWFICNQCTTVDLSVKPDHLLPSLTFLEGKRWSGLIDYCWLSYSYCFMLPVLQAACSFNLWLLNVLFPFPQSISPGLVRTEFRGRATNAKDLEQSKKDYDKICAEVCCITLLQWNSITLCLLCLLTVYRYWKQKILQVQFCILCPHLQECRYHHRLGIMLGFHNR